MKNNTWVVVIVLLVLAGGAYFYRHQLKAMLMGSPAPAVQQAGTNPVSSTSSGDLSMTKTDPVKGSFLAGPNGMTLYRFDKDTAGVSNCSGGCATLWPPYTAAAAPATLPTNWTVFARADGSNQFAYKGMPVYYYSPDKQPGDITGDGVGGIWHLVKP